MEIRASRIAAKKPPCEQTRASAIAGSPHRDIGTRLDKDAASRREFRAAWTSLPRSGPRWSRIPMGEARRSRHTGRRRTPTLTRESSLDRPHAQARVEHLRECFCRVDCARAWHYENIRRDSEHAMLLHCGKIRNAIPERDHVALMFFGDANGVRHIAHVDDYFRIARHHLFERHGRICRHRIAKDVFSTRDFDHFIQIGRAPGDNQPVQAVGRASDHEHHADARKRPAANCSIA